MSRMVATQGCRQRHHLVVTDPLQIVATSRWVSLAPAPSTAHKLDAMSGLTYEQLRAQDGGAASDSLGAAARPDVVVPRQVAAQQHDGQGRPPRVARAGARAELVDAAEGDAVEPLQDRCAWLADAMLRMDKAVSQ